VGGLTVRHGSVLGPLAQVRPELSGSQGGTRVARWISVSISSLWVLPLWPELLAQQLLDQCILDAGFFFPSTRVACEPASARQRHKRPEALFWAGSATPPQGSQALGGFTATWVRADSQAREARGVYTRALSRVSSPVGVDRRGAYSGVMANFAQGVGMQAGLLPRFAVAHIPGGVSAVVARAGASSRSRRVLAQVSSRPTYVRAAHLSPTDVEPHRNYLPA
jgi:hypothetical protein